MEECLVQMWLRIIFKFINLVHFMTVLSRALIKPLLDWFVTGRHIP